MQGSPTTTRTGRRRNSPWFRDPLQINGDLPYPSGCPKRWLLSPNPSPSGAGGSSRRGAEARWRFRPGCGVGKVHARYPRFFWGGILGKFIFLQTKAGAENSFDVSVFPFLPIPSLRLCASAPLRESSPSGTRMPLEVALLMPQVSAAALLSAARRLAIGSAAVHISSSCEAMKAASQKKAESMNP